MRRGLAWHTDAFFSAAGPPIPALGNPGHGVWNKVGARKYVSTHVQLTFDETLQLNGSLGLSQQITLDGKDSYTSVNTATIFGLDGNEIVTFHGLDREGHTTQGPGGALIRTRGGYPPGAGSCSGRMPPRISGAPVTGGAPSKYNPRPRPLRSTDMATGRIGSIKEALEGARQHNARYRTPQPTGHSADWRCDRGLITACPLRRRLPPCDCSIVSSDTTSTRTA